MPSGAIPLTVMYEERPANGPFSYCECDVLKLDDVGGRRALRTLLCVVAHLRALGQRLEAAALDRAVMHEQVLALVIGRDEPEALVVVEALDGSRCHLNFSFRMCALRNAEGAGQQLRTSWSLATSRRPAR